MDERIILNTNGKIDLTIPKDFEEYDNTIDIYLHGTDELVGMIWFEDFSDDEFTKYYGNVGYVIKEKFRRKGYAFSALKLLKKVMLDNDIDKMIFSIFPNNIASCKTVEKLGARILCYRNVPKNHSLYNFSENQVVIYEYNIERNSKYEEDKTKKHL